MSPLLTLVSRGQGEQRGAGYAGYMWAAPARSNHRRDDRRGMMRAARRTQAHLLVQAPLAGRGIARRPASPPAGCRVPARDPQPGQAQVGVCRSHAEDVEIIWKSALWPGAPASYGQLCV